MRDKTGSYDIVFWTAVGVALYNAFSSAITSYLVKKNAEKQTDIDVPIFSES